jgi:hypothetical protein
VRLFAGQAAGFATGEPDIKRPLADGADAPAIDGIAVAVRELGREPVTRRADKPGELTLTRSSMLVVAIRLSLSLNPPNSFVG